MNDKNVIKIILEGRPEDIGDARFDAFVKQLNNILELLKHADRVLFGNKRNGKSYFKVADLQHSSPACITLERKCEDVTNSDKIAADIIALNELFSDIERGDIKFLEKHQNVTSFTVENLKDTAIKFPNEMTYAFDEKADTKGSKILLYKKKINDNSLEDEVEAMISYSGFLREINVQDIPHTFYIYPLTGVKKIKCQFSENFQDILASSIGKKIAVTGKGKYGKNKMFRKCK